MATATIYRMYHVDLDTPFIWDKDMSPKERLTAWLAMARSDPEEAFKCLILDDVDGKLEEL